MLLEELRAEVVETGLKMVRFGLVRGTCGNVSARDPETGYVVITPSRRDYHRTDPCHCLVCAPDASIVDGNVKPSTELGMHLAIYAARPDVNGIVHTHALYATAFSVAGLQVPIPLAAEAGLGHELLPTASAADPGSEALAIAAAAALKNRDACVLEGHGVVTIGPTLARAFARACAVEDSAQVAFISQMLRCMGAPPQALPHQGARSDAG